MAEGDFPKVDGDVLFASEINLMHGKIQQVYTGAGFDSFATNTTDTQDHELDAVITTNDSNYVKIKITGKATADAETSVAFVKLKAQIKEIGGAYSDIIVFQTILDVSGIPTTLISTGVTYEIIATLTAGQKTNGFQIKVFSESRTNDVSRSAAFTNIQTVQELA